MLGIIIIAHGGLAQEMATVLEHVVGPQSQLVAIGIGADDDIEKRREDLQAAITEVNSGKGVVICTDMFGGTPSNLAISMLDQNPVDVLAGFNLPALVKLASVRDKASLPDAIKQAYEAGHKYMNVASQLLNPN
ncbi:MAG TPA: PTS sugar transporter subunit IIA [Alphaproteobacteria bacterium]